MSKMERLRRAIAAACSPLGFEEMDVSVSPKAISIQSAGVYVVPALSSGKRVWRGVSSMRVRSVAGEDERTIRTVLFEEPFEREWQVARRIALYIAETRIDAAIDAAIAE